MRCAANNFVQNKLHYAVPACRVHIQHSTQEPTADNIEKKFPAQLTNVIIQSGGRMKHAAHPSVLHSRKRTQSQTHTFTAGIRVSMKPYSYSGHCSTSVRHHNCVWSLAAKPNHINMLRCASSTTRRIPSVHNNKLNANICMYTL